MGPNWYRNIVVLPGTFGSASKGVQCELAHLNKNAPFGKSATACTTNELRILAANTAIQTRMTHVLKQTHQLSTLHSFAN